MIKNLKSDRRTLFYGWNCRQLKTDTFFTIWEMESLKHSKKGPWGWNTKKIKIYLN